MTETATTTTEIESVDAVVPPYRCVPMPVFQALIAFLETQKLGEVKNLYNALQQCVEGGGRDHPS